MVKNQHGIIMNCTKCKLSDFRRNIVIGRGSLPCDVCFIGEAPGSQEDLFSEAFIGPSGKLLDEMIKEALQNKKLSFYFTNTVMCRPCDSIGGSNREPTEEEILLCSGNVQKIIDRSKAKLFILVGNVAEKYMKNRVQPYRKIMHPSAILRHGGKQSSYYLNEMNKLKQIFKEFTK